MQMNGRFYLMSKDKKFSNQFSVHVSIHNVNKPHGSHSNSYRGFEK